MSARNGMRLVRHRPASGDGCVLRIHPLKPHERESSSSACGSSAGLLALFRWPARNIPEPWMGPIERAFVVRTVSSGEGGSFWRDRIWNCSSWT